VLARAILLLLCLCWLPIRAAAQTPPTFDTAFPVIAKQVDNAEAKIDAVQASTAPGNVDDAILQAGLANLGPADQALDATVAALTPRIAAIDARLGQLGPAPTAGQPAEPVEIAAERKQLIGTREAIDGELKQAKLLIVELDQLTIHIEERRRELFARHLWASSQSILSPQLWREFAKAMPGDVHRLSLAFAAENRAWTRALDRPGVFLGQLAALIGATLILLPGRRALNRLATRRAAASPTSRLAQSMLAVALVVIAVTIPLAAGLLLRAVLVETGALTPAFARLATLILRVAVFAALVEGLGRALLSPRRAEWRLAPVSDALVARAHHFPGRIALAVALASLVSGVNSTLGLSLAGSVATNCLTLVIELIVIGRALGTAGRASTQTQATDAASGASGLPWVLAALAAWLGLIAAALAILVGYLALASFVTRELVWIAVVLSGLFLLIRLADDLFPALLGPTARAGRAVQTAIGISAAALKQIAILLSGFTRAALLLFGWTLIIAPFGASATDVFGRVTSDDLVIHVGQTTISPGTIVGGVLILLAGLLITRGVRGWLESRYLPETAIDIGVRTSLGSAVTYVGAILAVVFASTFLGLSLDRIALFASALSIGIGFGLQSVISNFVSGLILMVERPVKVGDWIAIGDLEGDVRKVSVRATEIEMMDRSRLIVPNLDLITKTVRNVTHTGAVGRIRIVLKVNDDADPAALRKLILAHLAAHPEVLADPKPAVYLTEARDGGLEFSSFAFVPSARDVYRVRSDLLFAIVPDLKSNGFALANSTPIVNLGVDGRLIEPTPTPAQA